MRERLWSQLMLVLYRSGRKAEALAAYDEMRERIAAALAADPGPAPRELMRRIAADDPALLAPAPCAGSCAEYVHSLGG